MTGRGSSHSFSLVVLCLAAALLAGCPRGVDAPAPPSRTGAPTATTTATTSAPPAPSVPRDEPDPETETRRPAAGFATCRLDGPPVDLIVDAGFRPKRLRSLATGAYGERAVVAWPIDPSHAAYAILGADLAATGRGTVAITAADRLFDARPVDGGLVLTTHQVCADRARFEKCLYARTILRGAPVGEELVVRTREWITQRFELPDGADAWWSLRSHMYIAPVIERWRFSPDAGVRAEKLAELEGGEIATAVGLARSGDEIVAATIDENGRLRLHRLGAESAIVRGFPPQARVAAFGVDGAGVVIAFSAADSRGEPRGLRIARIAENGAIVGRPEPLAEDASLPAALDSGPVGAATVTGGRLVFTRRDAAGRATSAPIAVASRLAGHGPDAPAASAFRVERSGESFETYGIAYSTFEGDGFEVKLQRVACAP